jgi:hypothetical protein
VPHQKKSSPGVHYDSLTVASNETMNDNGKYDKGNDLLDGGLLDALKSNNTHRRNASIMHHASSMASSLHYVNRASLQLIIVRVKEE